MPAGLAAIDRRGSPAAAIVVVGIAIAALALTGNVKTTWSFSAFTVLVYYAITNLAALRLPKEKRLYSPAIAWVGLAACVFLAFWVERDVWMIGLGLIAAGVAWHVAAQRLRRS
jgi:basic amino acid/polyamine antiporter, APA family